MDSHVSPLRAGRRCKAAAGKPAAGCTIGPHPATVLEPRLRRRAAGEAEVGVRTRLGVAVALAPAVLVSVPASGAAGRECVVPRLVGVRLSSARGALARSGCVTHVGQLPGHGPYNSPPHPEPAQLVGAQSPSPGSQAHSVTIWLRPVCDQPERPVPAFDRATQHPRRRRADRRHLPRGRSAATADGVRDRDPVGRDAGDHHPLGRSRVDAIGARGAGRRLPTASGPLSRLGRALLGGGIAARRADTLLHDLAA